MTSRSSGLTIRPLDGSTIEEAANVVAREHAHIHSLRPQMPAEWTDPRHCHAALAELLGDGFRGFVAHRDGRCVGVMCGRTIDAVGFVPAHGLAVDPNALDATGIAASLLANVAPVLLRDGAVRFAIDHVDLEPLATALSNVGFGRGGVFASQRTRPAEAGADVEVRIGTAGDLDVIADLSHVEYTHRSTPPIYAPSPARALGDTRAIHERLHDEGAVHFLARWDGNDVGLVTVEFTTSTPRLCPTGQPYIGPTATHPSARGQGVGHALVYRVLNWAAGNGYETLSVDFDSPNPLSRPFWLGLGFAPTGYRVRRTLDATLLPTRAT